MTAAPMKFPEAWQIVANHAKPGVLFRRHTLRVETVARTIQWLATRHEPEYVELMDKWRVEGEADGNQLEDLFDLTMLVVDCMHQHRHNATRDHLQQLHADVPALVTAALAIGAVDDSEKLPHLAEALDALADVAGRIQAAAAVAASSAARGEP